MIRDRTWRLQLRHEVVDRFSHQAALATQALKARLQGLSVARLQLAASLVAKPGLHLDPNSGRSERSSDCRSALRGSPSTKFFCSLVLLASRRSITPASSLEVRDASRAACITSVWLPRGNRVAGDRAVLENAS